MTAYASDGAGQLVGNVDTSGNTTSYSYDPNGNRIGAGYVVGPDDELLADPTHTYTYDADGRMTSAVDTTTGQLTTYSWDARGRLVGASVYAANGSLEESVSYTYDTLNQLVRRVVTGPTGNVLSDERYANEVTSLAAPVVTAGTTSQASLDNLAAVIGADGTVTDRYLYGQGTDQVLAQDSPGSGTQWLLTDNQGTVRAVAATNPTTGVTAVIKQLTYDAFGNVTSDSNPAVSVRFGYTGRWVDSVTGLQNNRARWYDATDGRWIIQDPMGFNAGQANLYVYVGNNPTGATDPSGEGVRSWLQDSWVGRRVVNVFDGAAELPCIVRDLAYTGYVGIAQPYKNPNWQPNYWSMTAMAMDHATATNNKAAQEDIYRNWALNSASGGLYGLFMVGYALGNGDSTPLEQTIGGFLLMRGMRVAGGRGSLPSVGPTPTPPTPPPVRYIWRPARVDGTRAAPSPPVPPTPPPPPPPRWVPPARVPPTVPEPPLAPDTPPHGTPVPRSGLNTLLPRGNPSPAQGELPTPNPSQSPNPATPNPPQPPTSPPPRLPAAPTPAPEPPLAPDTPVTGPLRPYGNWRRVELPPARPSPPPVPTPPPAPGVTWGQFLSQVSGVSIPSILVDLIYASLTRPASKP